MIYTEEQLDNMRKELELGIAIVEEELALLNEDLDLFRNEDSAQDIHAKILNAHRKIENFKHKIGLIDSGYLGAEKFYSVNTVVHAWRDGRTESIDLNNLRMYGMR